MTAHSLKLKSLDDRKFGKIRADYINCIFKHPMGTIKYGLIISNNRVPWTRDFDWKVISCM